MSCRVQSIQHARRRQYHRTGANRRDNSLLPPNEFENLRIISCMQPRTASAGYNQQIQLRRLVDGVVRQNPKSVGALNSLGIFPNDDRSAWLAKLCTHAENLKRSNKIELLHGVENEDANCDF